MQWFLFGRRWLWFYTLLLGIVFISSYIAFSLGYEFHFKALYWLFFVLVFTINFLPTLFFSLGGIVQKKSASHLPNNIEPIEFLVIIPAYNERMVILNSVKSLLKQRTGSHYQARIVVAFNGTDDTGQIAKSHGAEVFTTPIPKCGKSAAIAYVLDQIPAVNDRYVIIIDADNVVADDFLANVAIACQSKKLAYQCNHQPLLASQNWVSKGLQSSYCASSRLYNLGRSQVLDSALLCGTGMVLQEGILRKLWSAVKTQTEDIELNGLLSLRYNTGVTWITSAVFYDEKPDAIDVAIRQRVRWMVGHMRCAYFYSGALVRQFLRTGSLRALELAWYYLMPFSLLISALWLLLLIPIALLGYHYDILRYQSLLLGTSLCFVLYIFILPALGYFLQQTNLPTAKRLQESALFALYSIGFATVVWPIAILFACVSISSTTWIFHTPHKANAH